MNFSKLIDTIVQVLKENGPELLTAFGVVGVGTTAYYAAKAGYHSAEAVVLDPELKYASKKEKIKQTWPLYMPMVITGTGTVACIIFASKGNAKRTAAAMAAYTVTEKSFSEYRDKMIEQHNANKDQKVLDAVAQDRVLATPPPSNGIIILGRDESLFCELHTGRYFKSDMNALNKAVNAVNAWIIGDRRASLNDFYNEIGLPPTDESSHQGWDDGELMALSFSGVITEDDRPCIAFRYNYVKPLR